MSTEAFTDFHFPGQWLEEVDSEGRQLLADEAEILLVGAQLRLVSQTAPRSAAEVIFFQMLFSCCHPQPTQRALSVEKPLLTIFRSYFSHHHDPRATF